MKTISQIVILMLLPLIGINGQKSINVATDSIKVGKNTLPGLSVNIPYANYERTLKVWLKELESGTKSKVAKENNELSIFGANLKDVSPTPMNVYSKLVAGDSVLQLYASFELSKDKYIEKNTMETEYSRAKDFLKQFAKNQYIEVAKGIVDDEDKKLRDKEKELSSLEREKSRLQKDIQSNGTTIINENNNIAVQTNELKTVSASIIDNNSQLGTMDEGPAKEERQKYIKDLEKRKKKALSSIESSENRINNANSDTDKDKGEIARNEAMQETVRQEIALQEQVLRKVNDKLTRIKAY